MGMYTAVSNPDQWMVVLRSLTDDGLTVDTTFHEEEPPEAGPTPGIAFYSLAEAVISFLEDQFNDPARLGDFVLVLADRPRTGQEVMVELERALGLPGEVIEARWEAWWEAAVRSAEGIEASP